MRPKGKRQQTNRNPNRRFVESAFAKDQNQKWADEENRTTERSKTDVRKIRRVAKSFKEHFVNVPGNRVKREEAVMVPRLFHHIRDVGITEIEERVKAGVIVESGEKPERNRNNQKVNEHPRFLAGVLGKRA